MIFVLYKAYMSVTADVKETVTIVDIAFTEG